MLRLFYRSRTTNLKGMTSMTPTTNQELMNMITMIGCNKDDFYHMIGNCKNVSFSSGSYDTNYTIFCGSHIVGYFDHKGNLLEVITCM